MKRHFKPQTYERRVVSSCLKKVNIYKRFLYTITPHEKDRDSLGCSLCHPWISCLVQVIQIQVNPIVFANRFICQCIAVFCKKIERDLYLSKVNRFSLANANLEKTYESFLSTIIPQGKNWVSFDPRSQTLSGEDSTWMVDRLEIPRVVDFFFFLFDYTIELFWLFQNTSFVLSRKRENPVVVTIGTLLHHIHVEF